MDVAKQQASVQGGKKFSRGTAQQVCYAAQLTLKAQFPKRNNKVELLRN